MYVSKIDIKNFRCFNGQGTTIDFNGSNSAFIGCNGSGKTTILEALQLIFGKDYLPSKITEKDFYDEASSIKDKIFIEAETTQPFFITLEVRSEVGQLEKLIVPCKRIRLEIKRREKAEKLLDDPYIINKTVVPITGTIPDSTYDLLNSPSERLATKIIQTSKEFYTVNFELKSKQERVAKVLLYQLNFNPNKLFKLPVSYYLNKDRGDEVSGLYSTMAKVLTDLHWKYRRKASSDEPTTAEDDYNNLAVKLRSLVDEKGALISKMNEKVKKITTIDLDFQLDFIDMEQPYRSAFVTKIIGKKYLLPQNLGSGYEILLAYALLSYISELEKDPVIFIIDEPELHLHSDWQKKLYLEFHNQANIQAVYSTQSEKFISLKNWKEIRHIRDCKVYPQKETLDEEVTISPTETCPKSALLDDYAERNLHISTFLEENLELFFTRKCILVEGPAEKYALPKLLSLKGFDISNYSASVISVWGKGKMKQYQMICQCFGINYFTLFDADAKPDETFDNNIANQAIIDNAVNGNLAMFSSSFEDLLGVSNFNAVVTRIDNLTNLTSINAEIIEKLDLIESFLSE